MVKARLYKPNDYSVINEWFEKRLNQPLDREILSTTGWITDELACGFLYLTNSKIAFMDIFIGNPEKPREEIHEAFEVIKDEMFVYAKNLGLKMLFCNTKKETIKDLLIKNNFTYTGIHSSFCKEI